ncbi:ATP12 family chaperone protein [Aestuariivirga sp.]|uniref:ATP12 family chaperone protein n=1 Tax=Aestuariivirga sp. TaxID=2650926 RepID=UPI0025C0C46A|nr:ATP12 family protein [Aestuariivirga sp.]MCA3555181.1 ATPase [Aestuariivirga sp.]
MTARRRFYKDVTVTGELGIALDGRPVKTPMKAPLRLPTRALARIVAAEWAEQGDEITPATMYFTKLANTAIDRVAKHRAAIVREAVDYANSDLVCYRTDRPPELVARHVGAWDPIIDWAMTDLDAPFEVTVGILHRPQPQAALAAFGEAVKALSDFELAAFHSIMTLTGSALIAMMLARQAATPEAAWAAAHVDEDYQTGHWGEDAEAQARRAARHAEFMACCRFMALARG